MNDAVMYVLYICALKETQNEEIKNPKTSSNNKLMKDGSAANNKHLFTAGLAGTLRFDDLVIFIPGSESCLASEHCSGADPPPAKLYHYLHITKREFVLSERVWPFFFIKSLILDIEPRAIDHSHAGHGPPDLHPPSSLSQTSNMEVV